MSDDLKRTPLCAEHERVGGKMVPFSGWYMPVQYSGLMDEHHAVRRQVGLFDVSHMGEFRIRGPQACEFLETVTTNHVAKLTAGRIHYTLLTYPQGTIVDDLLIYCFEPNHFLAVVNAGNIEKDWEWVSQHAQGFDVEVTNESDLTAQLALQGPKAQQVLQTLVRDSLDDMAYYHFRMDQVAGIEAMVSRTGYTGEDGFEIYVHAQHAVALWRALMKAGEPFQIKPAGLGARDTLRLEARMALYGNDIDHTTSALEAGLGWVVKFKKEPHFVGRDTLLQEKKAGSTRKLIGFELTGRGIARHGYEILSPAGDSIGTVTSGSHSPTLEKSIGMGYVPTEFSAEDADIAIRIRKHIVPAKVVKGPFYQRS